MDTLLAILGSPLYVFRVLPEGFAVNQFKNGSYHSGYLTTGTKRCTCLGYVKFGDCKHLKMLRNEWGWLKGVSAEFARLVWGDLLASLVEHGWADDSMPTSEHDLIEEVQCIEVGLEEKPELGGVDIVKAVSVREFGRERSLAICFNFEQE